MLINPQPHIRSLRNKYNDDKSIFKGLLHKFVSIDYVDGRTVTGEVIGVYNERVFMWHPRNRDTLALFKCNRPDQGLDSFTTDPNSDNAVFTLNSDEISTITMVPPASDATTYVEYLRSHDITLQHQTIQVNILVPSILKLAPQINLI